MMITDNASVSSVTSWKEKFRSFKDATGPAPNRRSASIASRGEHYVSSGRGGAGNMHTEDDDERGRGRVRPTDGPDDFSMTEGREVETRHDHTTHLGRGGAGNVRSPSRDPASDRAAAEADHARVIRALQDEDRLGAIHSTGRGGAGNINRSRSREPTLIGTGTGTTHRPFITAPRASSATRGGPANAHGTGYDLHAERAALGTLTEETRGRHKPFSFFSSGAGHKHDASAVESGAKMGRLA